MKKIILLFISFTLAQTFAQQISGPELLRKSIQFHDPEGNWETFQGTLQVMMKIPDKPSRNSTISIDLPNQYFYLKAIQEEKITEYTLDKESCWIKFNQETPTEAEKLANKLSCDRAKMYRDYYTFLYGLPMKLNDPGTIIHEQVILKNFQGNEYLVLKVTYQKEVGEDTWYFYFHPETYAMEVYQFYHDEDKNDGEYIILSEIETVQGIKMPKKRDWYYNHNDQFIGTDLLWWFYEKRI